MADESAQAGGGGGIRASPFSVGRGVCGAGMRVVPVGGHRWRAGEQPGRVPRTGVHPVVRFEGAPVPPMIDFVGYGRAVDLLSIRPGQVRRFATGGEYRGTVPAMQPGFLRRGYEGPATLPLGPHPAVLRHTPTAFLLRPARLAAGSVRAGRQQTAPAPRCPGTRSGRFRHGPRRRHRSARVGRRRTAPGAAPAWGPPPVSDREENTAGHSRAGAGGAPALGRPVSGRR